MTTTTASAPRSSADWIAIEQATFFPNRRPPMVIERGQGSRVWDVEGREYLDMIAGIAVSVARALQPGRPARARRAVGQADPHLEPLLQHPPARAGRSC